MNTLAPARRLDSLDILRGVTIAAMLMVNNPGSWSHIYWPLEHAAWNGWTLTDLVFPFFLFMVGMSMMFSFSKRLAAGDSRRTLLAHVLRRALALILLGWWGGTWSPVLFPGDSGFGGMGGLLLRVGYPLAMLSAVVLLAGTLRKNQWLAGLGIGAAMLLAGAALSGWTDPLLSRIAGMRFPGVLVRIGVCYLAAAAIYFSAPSAKGIGRWIIGLLGGYAVWMMLVPIPGFGQPDLLSAFPTADTPLDQLFSNWAFYIDYHLLGTHTWSARQLYDAAGNLIWSFDPEGVISTISATGSVLFGILAGLWMQRTDKDDAEKLNGMFVAAVWLMAAGLVFSIWMPINKRIWTSSYTVFTSGMAFLTLATLFHLVDMRGHRRWAQPLRAYGRNAIFAFVASGMMATTIGSIRVGSTSLKGSIFETLRSVAPSQEFASFVFAAAFVTLWAAVVWWMDRRRLYFKI